ncbi:hypothetical protein MMC26_002165 [Xylographa opegraphella]|nr:hypothetical protein [Xylographa opegraphella]
MAHSCNYQISLRTSTIHISPINRTATTKIQIDPLFTTMNFTSPISTISPLEIWASYDGLLWLCANTTTCLVYLEVCQRRNEDVEIWAAVKECQYAQFAARTAWMAVAGSIRNGIDTARAVQTAHEAQARYDGLSEHRAQLKAIAEARRAAWMVGHPVVRRFA